MESRCRLLAYERNDRHDKLYMDRVFSFFILKGFETTYLAFLLFRNTHREPSLKNVDESCTTALWLHKCFKRKRSWMLLVSGDNIIQRNAIRPDGPQRKGTCNSLVTWPWLVRRSILFPKIVKKVENKELDRPWKHLNTQVRFSSDTAEQWV